MNSMIAILPLGNERGTGPEASSDCFWDRYWGVAGQLKADIFHYR